MLWMVSNKLEGLGQMTLECNARSLQVLFDSATSEGKGFEAWQGQSNWRVYSWVFYPLPAVHKLTSMKGHVMFMFSDVEYPLSLRVMEQMLKLKLREPVFESAEPDREITRSSVKLGQSRNTLLRDIQQNLLRAVVSPDTLVPPVDQPISSSAPTAMVSSSAEGPSIAAEDVIASEPSIQAVLNEGQVQVPSPRKIIPRARKKVRRGVLDLDDADDKFLDFRDHSLIGLDGTCIKFNFLGQIIRLLDRDDLTTLYGMVSNKLEGTRPNDIGMQLLGDLQVLFDSATSEGKGFEAWQGQSNWRVYSWVFYPLSAVHKLTSMNLLSLFTVSNMDQQITMISQIDPMLDDVKIVVRVISIWKSHPFGKPNQICGVEGNRIQASIKADSMNRDMVDVIGTIVSISQPIPFEYLGKEKMRKTVILQDIEGAQLECCFFYDWIKKLDVVSNHQSDSITPVVMILQLARVKYFNKKPSINPAVFSTKLYIDEDLPEIHAFRKRYQEVDGYDATKTAISVYTPVKKEDTPEEFFAGGIKKMVGCIRESAWDTNTHLTFTHFPEEYDCIVYGKVHKIHREYGWTYIGCKRCGRVAKPFEEDEDDSSSKKQVGSSKTEKAKQQFWTCKETDDSLETPVQKSVENSQSSSILRYKESIPFNLEFTPTRKVTAENSSEGGSGSSGKRKVVDLDEFTPTGKVTTENSSEGGSGSSGKRTIVDLDDFDDKEYEARKGKRAMDTNKSQDAKKCNDLSKENSPSVVVVSDDDIDFDDELRIVFKRTSNDFTTNSSKKAKFTCIDELIDDDIDQHHDEVPNEVDLVSPKSNEMYPNNHSHLDDFKDEETQVQQLL
ncbi:hypothetical protein CTI12_AA339840 [Artemisia annua]|uniref:Replication protein A 70 kDa DNA-binding subunit B n=1 Tax=Artemisia annua TaxID=35608 RepID=A0A2U1MU90_ARTAN|nr:hypothetical protein CTI12_AA339840 [Artemisia annua]